MNVLDRRLGQRHQLAALAARYAVPAIYPNRARIDDSGGLMSYEADTLVAWRLGGTYAGRILKATSSPIFRPTTIKPVVNRKTAGALGTEVPPSILIRADEVIE
jgi:putative ABC transport system substrate-binding protein